MQDVAHIAAVAVAGAAIFAVTWGDGTSSEADLAGWIAHGSGRIAPMKDPVIFARTARGRYCRGVTRDGDEGDLAIDSEHLRMIADYQAPFAAE